MADVAQNMRPMGPLPEVIPTAGGPVSYRETFRRWVYEGTRSDLLALGLMPVQTVFPGDLPGRHRCTFKTSAGRQGTIARAPWLGPQGFAARVYFNADDCAKEVALTRAKEAQRKRSEAVAEAAAETRRRMERMKHSAADFRADVEHSCEMLLPIVLQASQGEGGMTLGGYRFDEHTRLQVAHHADSIKRLIQGGRVVFDRATRDRHSRWCAQPLREADPDFTSAIGRLCNAGPLAEPE